MAVSFCVFFFEAFAYNLIFVDRILPAAGKQSLAVPFGILFNIAWFLAIWSYIKAHLTDPGKVPDQWYDFVIRSGANLNVVPSSPGWHLGSSTLCHHCAQPRPERAHHCKVCNMCVLRYDHHCPWINNCVGFQNHKFFLLTACYVWLTSTIVLITTMPEVVELLAAFCRVQDGRRWGLRKAVHSNDLHLLLIFSFLADVIAVLMSMLIAVHLPLALSNLTSVEANFVAEEEENSSWAEPPDNPFDQGHKVSNLAQMFGACDTMWLLPVAPRRPLSDGILYQRCGTLAGLDGVELAETVFELEDEDIEHLWRMRYEHWKAPRSPVPASASKGPFELVFNWLKGTSSCTSGNQANIDI